VAGGLHPDSKPGDIVIGQQVFHHDYVWYHPNTEPEVRATSSVNYAIKNPLYFKSDSILVKKAEGVASKIAFQKVGENQPNVFVGTIATGDAFVSNNAKASQLFTNFNAYATEMEGAAVAQIAYTEKVPFLIIRSCSDNANSGASLDFATFLKSAATNAITLILGILGEL